MEEVTVRVLKRNKEIAVYEEGKGANAVRPLGKPGEYMVHINTRALGLDEGLYIVLIEFSDNGERVVYSTTVDLEK